MLLVVNAYKCSTLVLYYHIQWRRNDFRIGGGANFVIFKNDPCMKKICVFSLVSKKGTPFIEE